MKAKLIEWILRKLSEPLIRAIWIKKIEGLEKVPADKPIIIVANHASYLDFLVLGVMFNWGLKRNLIFWANQKIFEHFLFKHYARVYDSIMIDLTNRKDKSYWVKTFKALKQNKPVCIFPEGTRSRTGELGRFFEGYLKLAEKTGATLVPVVVENAYDIYPPGRPIPKFKKDITISVLDPIQLQNKDHTEDELYDLNIQIRNLFVSALGGDVIDAKPHTVRPRRHAA